jgi:hypothetical protein
MIISKIIDACKEEILDPLANLNLLAETAIKSSESLNKNTVTSHVSYPEYPHLFFNNKGQSKGECHSPQAKNPNQVQPIGDFLEGGPITRFTQLSSSR